MLTTVPVGTRKIEEYAKVVDYSIIDSLRRKAEKLKGLKVLNISSTAFGGGVAELLYAKIPLMRDLGLDVTWQVIGGDLPFFTVTKNLHNGLQGMDFLLTDHMIDIYEERNKSNAVSLKAEADIIIIHDPQPLAIIDFVEKNHSSKWIWRAHIDFSEPQEEVLNYISRFTPLYDGVVMTMANYAKPQMNIRRFYQAAPSIDPLSLKNSDLSGESVREILERLSISKEKPILTQVSRFDPWKDPFGVIDTYRLVKKEVDDLQLVLVASMATDDPEGWHYFEKTARYAGVDPSIIFFSNVTGVGNVEVNAIQRSSDVIIQKSKKEGFGLVVSEAMWKSKPVVGANVGGIKLQIQDSQNGFLIDTTEQAAEKVAFLLKNKQKSSEMGEAAHSYVKENFITPRALSNWLDIFQELV